MERKLKKQGLFISFLFIFIFLSLSFVSAKVTLGSEKGMIIETGHSDTLIQNQDFTFNVHVYNESNGMPITTGTTCYLDIYDTSGLHVVTAEQSAASEIFDYEFFILKGNFTEVEVHSYIVQCNNTAANLGGYRSDDFEVTASGRDGVYSPTALLLILIILAYILIAIGIYGEEFVPIVFGAFILFGASLYTYQYGLGAMANDTLPVLIFTLVNVGIGCYVSFKGIYEYLLNK